MIQLANGGNAVTSGGTIFAACVALLIAIRANLPKAPGARWGSSGVRLITRRALGVVSWRFQVISIVV